LGYGPEAEARADPTVRLLANELAAEFPKLSAELAEGQSYHAHSEAGVAAGTVVDGEFSVEPKLNPDGTLVQSTESARRTIDTMLHRQGHDVLFRAEALRRMDEAAENQRVQISDDVSVVKWQISHLTLVLDGPTMNPVVPIKIAYEFLALHLGVAVYEEIPPLAEARRVLRGGSPNSRQIVVERLEAEHPKPFHGIVFEGNSPYSKVQIRLFGKLAFRVHFKQLALGGPRAQYTHTLGDEKEFLAKHS
jgi:hypothetical protein